MELRTAKAAAAVFSILSVGLTAWSADSSEAVSLNVAVYYDANLPHKTVVEAEDLAAQIYRQSGVAVSWTNCQQPGIAGAPVKSCAQIAGPSHLMLRIVSHSLNLGGDVFGVAFLDADGSGAYCGVFLDRIEDLRASQRTGEAKILGIVVAHEIGHLLLGSNSHYRVGLMRARWLKNEFNKPQAGALAFTSDQSQRMRAKLLLSTRSAEESGP